jgi:hypothetical protein
MYRTNRIGTTNISTRNSLRQRRMKDVRKNFTYTVGKEDTLLTTAIGKITPKVSLEERAI